MRQIARSIMIQDANAEQDAVTQKKVHYYNKKKALCLDVTAADCS